MKTVAIFSAYISPHLGGIERYVESLSRQFIKKDIQTIIVTSNFNNAKTEEVIEGIKIMRIPVLNKFKNRYPIPKYNKQLKKTISKLDKYKIDAIIVNTRFHLTSHIGANYGYKNNIPVYLIEHGSNYVTLDNKFIDFFANRYEDFLTYKIKKKVSKFYGVSNACSNWIKKFNIKASGTWYNSIDCDEKNVVKTKHKNINFLYAGRIIKQKGVTNVLEAFRKLEEKYSNIHLYIAGDGPELALLKKKYFSNNIEFLGRLDYNLLKKYYLKTDVFLYPPLWPEGLPTSILEAGFMKCCVIATRQGGIIEIINSDNGILVQETVKSLYNAMKKTIDNPKLRKELTNNLYKTINEKFSWDVTSNKVIEDIMQGEKYEKNN